MFISLVRNNLSLFIFVVLFPSMYGYHLLAGLRLIPFFAGGWWGAVTLASGALMAVLLTMEAAAKRVWFEHLAFVSILVLVAAYALYFRLFGLPWQSGSEPLLMNIALLSAWIALYGIGYFWRVSISGLTLVAVCLFFMAASAILLMDPASLSFIAAEKFKNDLVANYQWWALCFCAAALVTLSYAGRRTQAVVLAGTYVVLYLLSSRSELYAMVGIGVLWTARQLRYRRFDTVALILATTIVTAGAVFGGAWAVTLNRPLIHEQASEIIVDKDPSSPDAEIVPPSNLRQTEIFQGTSSQSFVVRSEVLQRGLDDIRSSPVFGIYAGQLQDEGTWGDYIHNGLEAWRQYGILGFALILWLCADSTFRSARQWWKGEDATWRFALYVSVFATGLLIVSKTASWPMPALAWGLVAGLRVQQKRSDNHSVPVK